MSNPITRKYASFGQTFLKGTLKGQIASVFRDRELNPQKVLDFKAAIAAGDIKLGNEPFAKAFVQKLQALEIDLPKKLIKS